METIKGAKSTLAILVAINVLNFYDRNSLGALTEPIRKEFHLSDGQIGLMGSVFTWLYAVVGVPLGSFADRSSRKNLLAAGIAVWSALTGMAAFAGSYLILLISRLGFAVGEATVAPAATSWIGDLFPASKRAAPLALFMIGIPMGGAFAFFFSGPIAQAYGWRFAMFVAATPALVLIPLLLRLKEPRRGASENAPELAPAEFRAIRDLARIPTLWWIVASGALLNFNLYTMTTFVPALLSRVHRIGLASSGIYTGIIYLTGGIGGTAITAWIGDRVILRRRNGRLFWAALITAIAAPTALLAILSENLVVAVILMALSYGSLCTYYGLVYSSIHDIVAPPVRATAMSIYFLGMHFCGGAFGPLVVGRASDLMARHAANAARSAVVTDAFKAVGLQQAMLIVPIFSVLLGCVLYMGSRTVIADIERRAGDTKKPRDPAPVQVAVLSLPLHS